jgi:hypothetical protein
VRSQVISHYQSNGSFWCQHSVISVQLNIHALRLFQIEFRGSDSAIETIDFEANKLVVYLIPKSDNKAVPGMNVRHAYQRCFLLAARRRHLWALVCVIRKRNCDRAVICRR